MLSKNHIRILKRIKKNKMIRTEKPNKDLDYLFEQHLIEIIQYDKPGDYYAQPYLTEYGKAVLDNESRKQIKYRLTTVIAIVAAIGAYREELRSLLQAIVKLLK